MRKLKFIQSVAVTLCLIQFLGNSVTMSLAENASALQVQNTSGEAVPKGQSLVTQNENFKMIYNEKTAAVTIVRLSDGKSWCTNPDETNMDSTISSFNQESMKSQFLLTYYTSEAQSAEISSYVTALQKDQVTASKTDNGIKVTYEMGDLGKKYLIPSILSAQYMDTYMEQFTDDERAIVSKWYSKISLSSCTGSDRDRLLERYKSISEKNDLYVFRSTQIVSNLEKLNAAFRRVGYTEADLQRDNNENFVEEEEGNYYFKIALDYRLEADTFVVSVNTGEIVYNESFPPVKLTLLPFFGAAGTQEEGYMLVPDGCGALINLNNGKTGNGYPTFSTKLYGKDNAYISDSQANDTIHSVIPVFGIKSGEDALLAVIESGDAMAAVNASVSGKTTNYNTVNASFTLLSNQLQNSSTALGDNKLLLVEDKMYSGEYTIRYHFLSGEDANYSGMARCYRSYLENKGIFTGKGTGVKKLYINLMGDADITKSFLGVPYIGKVALTTFEQAQGILDELKDVGITSPVVQYSGWMNGGLSQGSAMRVVADKILGGKKGLSALEEYCESNSVALYPEVDLVRAYNDKWFDGFSSSKQAIRTLENKIAFDYQYNLVTNYYNASKPYAYLLSSNLFNNVTQRVLNGFEKMELSKHMALTGITENLYSDFNSHGQVNRQDAASAAGNSLKKISDSGYSLLGTYANGYLYEYLDHVVDIPTQTNGAPLEDESVPFLQMILSGNINYTGAAFNEVSSPEKELLKCIETGSGLYVRWMYAENSVVKDSSYDNLYAACYKNSFDTATQAYETLTKALEKVENSRIYSHKKLTDGVFLTVYENGYGVVVNYSENRYDYDGVMVQAKGYAYVERDKV